MDLLDLFFEYLFRNVWLINFSFSNTIIINFFFIGIFLCFSWNTLQSSHCQMHGGYPLKFLIILVDVKSFYFMIQLFIFFFNYAFGGSDTLRKFHKVTLLYLSLLWIHIHTIFILFFCFIFKFCFNKFLWFILDWVALDYCRIHVLLLCVSTFGMECFKLVYVSILWLFNLYGREELLVNYSVFLNIFC